MKTLYLDIFSGISGDMLIGALIDLGVDAGKLAEELKKLPLDGYHLHVGHGEKSQIHGTKFDVHVAHSHETGHEHDHDHGHEHHDHEHDHEHTHASGVKHSHGHSHEHSHAHDEHHGHEHSHGHDGHSHSHEHEHEHEHRHSRDFAGIEELILDSSLSDWVKQKAVNVFRRIAVAEGKVHGLPPEQVHFHEVGAVDSIVDIVGGCIALEMLGKPAVLASTVVEGTGWIRCAHGRMPIPAPATLEILGAAGVGMTQCEEPNELVTPTGAAMLAEFSQGFGPMRGLVAGKIGIGLGTRENKTRPNVLRAILGTTDASAKTGAANDWETDLIAVLQTNLDDINAEVLGNFVELALAKGALDVFHTPIQMKKNRPAVLLSVLCAVAEADQFSELILRETSAFGVRRAEMERRKLKREFATVKTGYGEVTVKIGKLNGETVQAAPEYESCKKLAEKTGVPLKSVYEAALAAKSMLQ